MLNRVRKTAVSVIAITLIGCSSPRVARGISSNAIRSIKVGMTEGQVKMILGQPLRIRPWGSDAVVYDYAIPGWALSSPSLWVFFDKGSVQTVQANRHRLVGDDQAVYEARADRPTFEGAAFESTFGSTR
jgi:hypothetical protein